MNTIEIVEKHIKSAGAAALVSGGITLILGIVSYATERTMGFIDEWSIFDAFIIFGLAFGIFKKSRFCASSMLIYFVVGKAMSVTTSDDLIAIPLALLFAYFFFKGAHATFVYHSRYKEKKEKTKRSRILAIIGIGMGSFTILIVVALIVLGSFIPETYILEEDQVPNKYRKKAMALNLISSDERIHLFYTDALFDIEEGMYFLTDKNLVLYTTFWDEPTSIIDLEQITSIIPTYDDSFLNDSFVDIETLTGYDFTFPLSSEYGRDKEFVEFIKERMNPDFLEANNQEDPSA